MIIKCLKCKTEFKQVNQRRYCLDCVTKTGHLKPEDYEFHLYKAHIRATFQDPVHQLKYNVIMKITDHLPKSWNND